MPNGLPLRTGVLVYSSNKGDLLELARLLDFYQLGSHALWDFFFKVQEALTVYLTVPTIRIILNSGELDPPPNRRGKKGRVHGEKEDAWKRAKQTRASIPTNSIKLCNKSSLRRVLCLRFTVYQLTGLLVSLLQGWNKKKKKKNYPVWYARRVNLSSNLK